MNRIVIGAFAALLFVAAGLFWWQGRAATERGAPPPSLAVGEEPLDALPDASGQGLRGAGLPEVSEASREERRFNRLDRNRDGRIARVEMLAPRAATFRKLDADRNNLLSFEEWAVKTGNRFRSADGNGDGMLTRQEFVATRPKPSSRPVCRCSPVPKGRGRAAPPASQAGESDSDEGDPVY